MRFPRNTKIFRGQLDVAPLAGVFFLMLIFLILASLIYIPGIPLQLPIGDHLAGAEGPRIAVAINSEGQVFLDNQLVDELQLKKRLKNFSEASSQPVTLILLADRAVENQVLVRVGILARDSGVQNILLATRPRAFEHDRRRAH